MHLAAKGLHVANYTPKTTEDNPIRVLLVDDNRLYREAFKRQLVLNNYAVEEAEDSSTAIEQIALQYPDVVITDLQMRTEHEGLDLIDSLRSMNPLLPVIMISAIGTLEDGATAIDRGAVAVISKARIEEDMDRLYRAMDESKVSHDANRAVWTQIEQYAKTLDLQEQDNGNDAAVLDAADVEQLSAWSADANLHPYLRQEALNQYLRANSARLREQTGALAERQQALHLPGLESPKEHAEKLAGELPAWDVCSPTTRESLQIAEFLYQCAASANFPLDFSRNIGFSYCFAVESEAKERTNRRVKRFLSEQSNLQRIRDMLEPNGKTLSVYYHQYLLRLLQQYPMDITVDNVRQTLQRLLEHQSHFKPDGLKALGILVVLFGRDYEWSKAGNIRRVSNPLGIKGLDTEEQALALAQKLTALQHQRNPYVHPEISEVEKLGSLRRTTFECIELLTKLI